MKKIGELVINNQGQLIYLNESEVNIVTYIIIDGVTDISPDMIPHMQFTYNSQIFYL